MKKIKVRVFDAYKNYSNQDYYKSLGCYDIFDLHMKIVDKDNCIKLNGTKIQIRDEDITEVDKVEFDYIERDALKMFKSSTEKARDLYDSCLRKEKRFKNILLEAACSSLGIYDVFEGEKWKCDLSPFGHCVYHSDESGESVCVFCGQPEERK